jgi:hypothetical protein
MSGLIRLKICKYSITQIIRIILERKPSEYAENPGNWILLENRLHWQFKVEKEILQTAVLGYILIYVHTKH